MYDPFTACKASIIKTKPVGWSSVRSLFDKKEKT